MKYLKNFLLLLFGSYVITSYTQLFVTPLLSMLRLKTWVTNLLFAVSNKYALWQNLAPTLGVLVLPMLASAIPGLIFYLARKRSFPYFLQVFWFVWVIEVTALAATYNNLVVTH